MAQNVSWTGYLLHPCQNGSMCDPITSDDQSPNEGKTKSESNFECNICFETAKEPVVTSCGHLFCWPCLCEWITRRQECPVCKALCQEKNIIPLYGQGNSKPTDQSRDLPKRPKGQRPPTAAHQPRQGTFFNNVHFGFFGFPFFGFTIGNVGPMGVPHDEDIPQGPELEEGEIRSRMFLCFGFLILAWLLFFSCEPILTP
jgi:hypothetical protein